MLKLRKKMLKACREYYREKDTERRKERLRKDVVMLRRLSRRGAGASPFADPARSCTTRWCGKRCR